MFQQLTTREMIMENMEKKNVEKNASAEENGLADLFGDMVNERDIGPEMSYDKSCLNLIDKFVVDREQAYIREKNKVGKC